MPFYEYVCQACGERHETLQKAGARPLRKCPHCAKNKLKKVVSRSAFQLKGAGWYVTDFRDNKSNKKPAGDAEHADKEKQEAAKDSTKADEKSKPEPAKDSAKSDDKSKPEPAKDSGKSDSKSSEGKSKPAKSKSADD